MSRIRDESPVVTPRRRLTGLAIAIVVAVLAGALSVSPAGAASGDVSTPQVLCNPDVTGSVGGSVSGGFHAVSPVRILDTRVSTGAVPGGCTAVVDLVSYVGSSATGVALDVVAIDAAADGFVTVYPCDASRPLASNVNPRAGDTTPNSVVVPLGTSRRVCVYSSVGTQLAVDLTGWFGPGGASYHGLTPSRIVDTRDPSLRPDGGSGPVGDGQVIVIPIAGLAPVPAGATAVAVNLTVTNTSAPGFVTAYPCDGLPPETSNGNYLVGDTRATHAIVGLDGGGSLCVYTLVQLDLVVDVAGWFGGTDGTRLQPIVGTRVVDFRNGTGGWSGPMAAGEVRSFDPTVAGTVPVGANAVLDVVATDAVGPGYLAFYPCGGAPPATSSVNFEPGVVSTNLSAVAVGSGGLVCVFANQATDVVVDVLGSFGSAGGLRDLAVDGHDLTPGFVPDGHDYGIRCDAGPNAWHVVAQGVPGSVVTISGADGSGNVTVVENDLVTITVNLVGGGSDHYYVRCLPNDFPTLSVNRPDDPAPGWYLLSSGLAATQGGPYALILDSHGAPVWYHRTATPVIGVQELPNGHLSWSPVLGPSFGVQPTGAFEERALDGTLVRTWSTVGTPTDHHEMLPLANGDMMLASYHQRDGVDVSALGPSLTSPANVVDAWIQEIRPDGSVAWEWHSEDHLGIAETTAAADGISVAVQGASGQVVDLVHLNSIDVDPATGDLLVSGRHLDALMRIRRDPGQPDDGKVLWKLGGTAPTDPGTIHLTILGDPFGGPVGQHDGRFAANGHVTMYDDQSQHSGATARAVEYAVDPGVGTATLVWHWDRPDGTNVAAMGSARRQSDGSVTISWGAAAPLMTDVERFGNIALAVVQLPGAYEYRAVKEPLAAFDPAVLRANAGH
jgi:hypothetical protein